MVNESKIRDVIVGKAGHLRPSVKHFLLFKHLNQPFTAWTSNCDEWHTWKIFNSYNLFL